MTAEVATSQPVSLAGRTASGSGEAGTPFYNSLMSMIDATQVENLRASQNQDMATVPRLAAPRAHGPAWAGSSSGWVTEPSWRVGHLLTYAAGAIAAVAVVGAIIGSISRLGTSSVVAADPAPGRTSLAVAGTAEVAKPMETSPSGRPGRPEPVVRKEEVAAEAGTETAKVKVPSVKSDTPPEVNRTTAIATGPEVKVTVRPETEGVKTISVRTVPVKASVGTKTETVGAADAAPAPTKVDEPAQTKADAEPVPFKVPAPGKSPQGGSTASAEEETSKEPAIDTPAPPPPIETGSIKTGSIKAGSTGKSPVASRMGRILSDVKMRAGPRNSEAVLTTIARGTAVEVVGCRAWCEVILRGQRGWVYKGFIDAPETAHGR